jgi:hypothetical protein
VIVKISIRETSWFDKDFAPAIPKSEPVDNRSRVTRCAKVPAAPDRTEGAGRPEQRARVIIVVANSSTVLSVQYRQIMGEWLLVISPIA